MARDWIKIEINTPDKPEIINIAEKLRIEQDAVAGKLFRLWMWADQNTIDGSAMPITDAFIDRFTHRRGFAAAMRAAGWLRGEDGCLMFPNFGRHNGTTAKNRAESLRRMQKSRAGKPSTWSNVAHRA